MFPLTVSKGIEIIRAPELMAFPEIVHAFSTRNGGVSNGPFRSLNLGIADGDTLKNILINRKRFYNTLNFAPSDIAQAEQVHSNRVAVVESNGPYPNCDALITNQVNLYLSIKTADCAAILLYDPRHQVIAAIHAGWRGTAEGIIANTINTMQARFQTNPGELIAAIGPALHVCCYKVKNNVAKKFSGSEIIQREGNLYLDLILAITNRLNAVGVQLDKISDSGYCTACQPDKFYSHRRDEGVTGRMLAVIGINQRNNH
ncbi:MAG TPA: peptidoglycan editing factor PgeF [Candidatus Marinimicrobia bacterium]|nr:peptidoglycan editing factor PgeF [Candidatus Neomarinimicrobiota bacterium]HRS52584.1 peptidoglycan editing factor PgeF [Candidatus Neomarinimicrobiota bacterium]HRU93178.1 peptidoglycan editing factor PgeF [Candidatus Neomarinimicrobiota bacterium]